MIRTVSAALGALLLSAAAVSAQAPSTTTPRGAPTTAPGPSRTAPYTSTPAATAPRPGGQTGAPRRRSYEACNRDALARRLRGAERRHFVSRCQLGYGRPLFRRRGPAVSN